MGWTFYNSSGEVLIIDGGVTATAASITNDLTVTSGNVVIATAGKGIDFSVQAASSTGTVGAEILDHYEEGTFTPSLADGWDAGAGGYAAQAGYYTRIGNVVHATGFVALNSISGLTGSSHARVVSLPFPHGTSANSETAVSIGHVGGISVTASESIAATMSLNENGFYLYLWDSTAGVTNMTVDEVSATGSIRFSVSYLIP